MHTEKINYPFFHTLKPIESFELSLRPHSCNVFVNSWPGSHPFGKPEQELYFQLSNLSPIILFLHFSIVTLTGSTLCFTAQVGDIAEPGLTRGHVGKGRLSTSAGQWGVWHQASGAAYCCSLLLAHGGGEGSPSSRTVCVSLLWAVWQLECLAWGNGDSSDLLSSFCSYWKTLSPTLFALSTEIQLVDLPAPCVTVFAPPHELPWSSRALLWPPEESVSSLMAPSRRKSLYFFLSPLFPPFAFFGSLPLLPAKLFLTQVREWRRERRTGLIENFSNNLEWVAVEAEG